MEKTVGIKTTVALGRGNASVLPSALFGIGTTWGCNKARSAGVVPVRRGVSPPRLISRPQTMSSYWVCSGSRWGRSISLSHVARHPPLSVVTSGTYGTSPRSLHSRNKSGASQTRVAPTNERSAEQRRLVSLPRPPPTSLTYFVSCPYLNR